MVHRSFFTRFDTWLMRERVEEEETEYKGFDSIASIRASIDFVSLFRPVRTRLTGGWQIAGWGGHRRRHANGSGWRRGLRSGRARCIHTRSGLCRQTEHFLHERSHVLVVGLLGNDSFEPLRQIIHLLIERKFRPITNIIRVNIDSVTLFISYRRLLKVIAPLSLPKLSHRKA